jgi:hypothetical protein
MTEPERQDPAPVEPEPVETRDQFSTGECGPDCPCNDF